MYAFLKLLLLSCSLQASTMTVLNAIISGLKDAETRRAFRRKHSLDQVVENLRKGNLIDSLETQLDIYDEWGAEELMEV